jgi:outer membrane protein assembly factor BamB
MSRLALSALLVMVLLVPARAEDWPIFGRDRTRNAVSPEAGAPTDWQVEVRDPKSGAVVKPAWNVKWSAQLGTRNLGGPIIADGLVWVGTNNGHPRDERLTRPRKDGKREPIDLSVLMCFRESDGQFLWQYTSPRLGVFVQDGPWHSMGTPLVEGDRLWLITNRCEVLCLDISPLRRGQGTPKELWKVDMRKEFGVFPHAPLMADGFSPSPAADAERLFVVTSNGVDESHIKIPAPDAPSLVCLDKRTGRALWQDASPGKDIMLSQRSSPLVIDIGSRTQVVVGQGDGWLRAFDAASGKLVWKCDLNPKGARYELGNGGNRNYITATPVLYDGRIYIATGQDPEHISGPGVLFCIDPNGTGDVSAELDDGRGKDKPNPNSRVVWRYGGPPPKEQERGSPVRNYLFGRAMANCTAHGGLVYACDLEGYVYCLDAKTGRLCWQHDAKAAIWCSPLWAGGKVYFATEDGDVCVFAHGAEKKHLTTVEMGPATEATPIYAAPVYANRTLYLMTEYHLYAIPGRP